MKSSTFGLGQSFKNKAIVLIGILYIVIKNAFKKAEQLPNS